MSDLHNFNAGRKSWKMYAKNLTSKDGDDLTISPYAGEDLILEVSGNGNILFKEDGITYNLADLSNNLILFQNSGGFTQLGSNLIGLAAFDYSAYSISISSDGSRLAIGAFGHDGGGSQSGLVKVFDYNGSNWIQVGSDIYGDSVGDSAGWYVCLSSDGTTLAISAKEDDDNGNNSGQVRVFQYNGSNWIQLGNDIDGEDPGDKLAYHISLSSNGTILSVVSRWNDNNGNNSGYVKIYEYTNSNWSQLGSSIEGNNGDSINSSSLSSNGTRIAVGAHNGNNGTGEVKVYDYNGSSWVQVGSSLFGSSDWFGWSVYLSSNGSRLAVGARLHDGNKGTIKVFDYNGSNWIQVGSDIDGEASNDMFGHSVSLSGDGKRLAGSSHLSSSGGYQRGTIRVFDYNGSDWIQLGENLEGDIDDVRLGSSLSLSSDGSTLAVGSASYHDLSNSIYYIGYAKVYKYNTGSSGVKVNNIREENNNNSNTLFYDICSGEITYNTSPTVNLTNYDDASFGNVDISGGIIITVNDVNSQNITLLKLKTNTNTPLIKHDFWQNSSGYADYQIYPSSASTTDFKIGGYNSTFETIRLNAVNGIEIYSNQSTNSYGNIKGNDASLNNVNISGNLNIKSGNLDISNGVINFFASDQQLLGPDTGIVQKVEDLSNSVGDLSNNLLTSNNDASFNNIDICGNLKINGNLLEERDGGFTEINFTSALNTKLSNIADNADVTPSWVPANDPGYVTTGNAQAPLETPVIATPSGNGSIALTSNAGFNTLLTYTPPFIPAELNVDNSITNSSLNPVASSAIHTALATKLDKTTHDSYFKSGYLVNNLIVMGNIASESPLVGHYVGHPYNYGLRGPYAWSIYTRGFNGPQAVQHIRFTCGESGSGAGRQFHPYTYLAGTASAQFAFNVSSDDRLKHNEVIIDNGLSVIRQMEMKRYQKTEKMFSPDYNGELDCPYITDAGVIAQDILKIPELSDFVSGGDYLDTSGNTITERYTLNYNAIFTYGLAGVQELDNIVQKQAAEITQLKNALNTLLKEAGKPTIKN